MGRKSEAAQTPFRRDKELRPSRAPSRGVGTIKKPPLVTTHRVGQRIAIAAVSPEARALGLDPGMALTHARMLVPGLAARDADPDADHALLTRLALFATRRWTPSAAVSDPTGLWLDLSGVSHLFGGEARMCERIIRFCARFGLTARIAVAGTLGAAHAIARHAHEAITLCSFGAEADAIAAFPLAALRVEEEVLAAASRLGIERIGELAAMPRAPLQRRFGETLLRRFDQALGRASEPMDPIVPEDAPSVCVRFLEPIATAEALETALADLMVSLVDGLAEAGLAVRALLLSCDRIDGDVQQIGIGTASVTRDGAHLLRLLAMKIETIEPGFGIEAMRLTVTRAESLGPQPIAGALAGEKPAPDLVPLVDRLAGRLGPRRIFRISALESDVPERSVRRVGPLSETMPWPRWPRPIRLLRRPEPVDNVLAVLPDQPPRRFTWRGRTHQIRRADGPERIHGEWWRRTGEAEAVRDYFQVEDQEGRRFWLYRRGDGVDARTGDLSWHLQGMFG